MKNMIFIIISRHNSYMMFMMYKKRKILNIEIQKYARNRS